MKRLTATLALFIFAILPGMASAHQGNPNFRSEIDSITPARLGQGIQLEIVNFDDHVRLVNKSGKEVVIKGYDGEPYARISADGTVEVNLNSPAYYLNEDRFAFGCEVVQEKAQTLTEVWPLIRFLFEPPVEDEKAWRKVMKGDAGRVLDEVETALAGIEPGEGGPNADGFTIEAVQTVIEPLPEKLGLGAGKVFQPIRVSITGTTISPGIFESVAALGREETLARIGSAKLRLAETPEQV